MAKARNRPTGQVIRTATNRPMAAGKRKHRNGNRDITTYTPLDQNAAATNRPLDGGRNEDRGDGRVS